MKPENFKMIKQKLYLTAFLFIISFNLIFSQDIHFSIFNGSPLFLNPANTGNFEGDWRLAGNYRDQWRALNEPFTSAVIGFDKNFTIYHQKIALGAFFLNDNSGGIGLTSNKVYLSAAYQKSFGKNLLIFGLQPGIVFRSFGNGDLTYPSDFDYEQGQFIPSAPGENKAYLDINFGTIWKRNIKIFEPEAGINFSHLNNPNESFFGSKERLPVRMSLHGKIKTKLTDEFYIQPSLLLMTQKKAKEMMLGANVGYKIIKHRSRVKEIFAGAYMRDGYFSDFDALSIVGGATVNRIDIMLNYDFNVSGLKVATNNKGAFEISFIYKSISTVLNSYSIPCERF